MNEDVFTEADAALLDSLVRAAEATDPIDYDGLFDYSEDE